MCLYAGASCAPNKAAPVPRILHSREYEGMPSSLWAENPLNSNCVTPQKFAQPHLPLLSCTIIQPTKQMIATHDVSIASTTFLRNMHKCTVTSHKVGPSTPLFLCFFI